MLAGYTTGAITELQNLPRHVDGFGTVPESNDWIRDCTAQVEVRTLVLRLIDILD